MFPNLKMCFFKFKKSPRIQKIIQYLKKDLSNTKPYSISKIVPLFKEKLFTSFKKSMQFQKMLVNLRNVHDFIKMLTYFKKKLMNLKTVHDLKNTLKLKKCS